MTFAIAPSAINATNIGMTAATASSILGAIEYYFENTNTAVNSGWISSSTWTNSGLTTGQSYAFRVKARAGLTNETAWSPVATATAQTDTNAPAPNPMTFATPPTAQGQNAITMTATNALDVNGVEYFFECTAGGGHSSAWQGSPIYTDTGLTLGTEYTYRVRARDKSPAQNTNVFSAALSATTDIPDVIPPTISFLSPTDGSTGVAADVQLTAAFNEDIAIGTGDITLKNLTDATQTTIPVTDSAQVSLSGSLLQINPAVSLTADKQYAVQIAPGTVKDLADNPFAGIADDTTWNFTVQPAGLVFADNFEPGTNVFGGITPNVTSYTVDNTSGQANTVLWVRASSGFNSSRNGLVDESENGGGNFTDPDGEQAYGFRYTNTGLTSNTNKIGALTAGTTITVSFDVVRDGYNGGSNYNALLVLFTNGAPRNAVETENKNTAAVLAKRSGNIPNTGNYQPISFSYVVGTNVVDNNGDVSGTSTTFLPGLLGMDVALRFQGSTYAANIDNVQVVITGGTSPTSTNALLNSLVLSPAGTLSPAFSAGVLNYTATNAFGATPTVTVVNADLTATNHLIYNGTTNLLTSGVASSPLALTLGAVNPVVVRVTAQDGVTVQTYTVNVTMQPSLIPPTLSRSVSNGILTLSWPSSNLTYTLQVQTNVLGKGLSTNWMPVSGTASVTSTNLPINSTQPTVFYRLVYP
jgi:hypothetical protein